MSATNYTPIYLYNSGTATNTPSAANLGAGELAINYADGKLFYKDGSAAVQVIAWKTTPTTAGGTGLTSYTAGDLPYYASGSALSKLGIGSANYVLTSSGTAPQYVAQSTLSVGLATNATNTAITDNTSSSATWYPTIVSATTGNLPQTTSSTKLSFVPSTGTLTATSHAGAWAGSTIGTNYGGTGLTSFTANQVFYASSTSAFAQSTNLQFSGTDLTIYGLTVGRGAGAVASNTAVGASALADNTTGSSNTAVGYQAGYNNSINNNITVVGYQAGFWQTGGNNTALGYSALNGNTSGGTGGGSNVAIGSQAMLNSTTGGNNTAVGVQALQANTTASNNTAVGYQAGYGITTGASNTYIGYAATQSGVAVTNEIVVGASLTGKGSNTAFIGGTSGAYNGANSAAWSITSDIRIKKNVASLESGLAVVQALRPVEFDYIENNKHDIGFIAQEYQTVLPAQVAEDADGMLSLNQNLVPYLVKAIQEQQAIIDSLTTRLTALESK